MDNIRMAPLLFGFFWPQGQSKFSGYIWEHAAVSDKEPHQILVSSASVSMNPLEVFEQVTENFLSFLFIINR